MRPRRTVAVRASACGRPAQIGRHVRILIGMRVRRISLAACVLALAGPGAARAACPTAPPAGGAPAPAACPTAPPAGALPDAAGLRSMNAFLGPLGARPTGSPQQRAYIDWIRHQVRAIPGVELSEQNSPIDRWRPRATKLRIRVDGRPRVLPVADAIPYTRDSGSKGVAGPAAVIAD